MVSLFYILTSLPWTRIPRYTDTVAYVPRMVSSKVAMVVVCSLQLMMADFLLIDASKTRWLSSRLLSPRSRQASPSLPVVRTEQVHWIGTSLVCNSEILEGLKQLSNERRGYRQPESRWRWNRSACSWNARSRCIVVVATADEVVDKAKSGNVVSKGQF